jgi:hypothetical protein
MVTMAGRPEVVKPGAVQWALALACTLLWVAKFWLIPRLNINWDEFLFLSQVHAATRGELTQGLQNSYTHLFAWLPYLPGDEISQIRVARVLMVVLLGVSALLVQRLASRWFAPEAAWTAALAFLALWPTLKHGGSFRADSLLLPLGMGALVALTSPRLTDRGRGLTAGVLLGCATAVSIKAVLLAPVVAALGIAHAGGWRRALRPMLWLAGAALLTATVVLVLHALTIGTHGAGRSSELASDAWGKMVRDAPWVPQMATLREMLIQDLPLWLIAAGGLGWTLWRRMWAVAACVLAMLPVLFYRNSYAYYYVVMWGPACVVIAAATTGLRELASRVARPVYATAITLGLAAAFCLQGLRQLSQLSEPRQAEQARVVAAVHQIFPMPVAYIGHSGMIASFRKVNFFMSSWGMENYVAGGRPFMQRTVERNRPPLVVASRPVLRPGTAAFAALLPEDQEIIQYMYQPYWGPIRVAGAAATLTGADTMTLQLPFGGRYRVESAQPLQVDGTQVDPGAVIEVDDARRFVQVQAGSRPTTTSPLSVRLLWAEARPAPPDPPTDLDFFDAL